MRILRCFFLQKCVCCGHSKEALGTQNMFSCGELEKIIPELSPNTPPNKSSEKILRTVLLTCSAGNQPKFHCQSSIL